MSKDVPRDLNDPQWRSQIDGLMQGDLSPDMKYWTPEARRTFYKSLEDALYNANLAKDDPNPETQKIGLLYAAAALSEAYKICMQHQQFGGREIADKLPNILGLELTVKFRDDAWKPSEDKDTPPPMKQYQVFKDQRLKMEQFLGLYEEQVNNRHTE